MENILPVPLPVPVCVLTPRELEVALALATGKKNSEIADDLEVSVKTIDTHRGHVLKKCGCRNNVELLRLLIRTSVVKIAADLVTA